MRPDTQEALVMREAQEVEGAPCRGPVPPSCAARPCAEAFTPSGTAGAEEAGPERLCQAGSHRGPGGGHGGGSGQGKTPLHSGLCARSSQETCPACPVCSHLSPPTLHLHRPGRPRLAPASASQPQRHSLSSQPLRDEGRADQPSRGPTPAASPFLVCIAQAEERAKLSQSPSTRGEHIGTTLTPLVPGTTAPCSSPRRRTPRQDAVHRKEPEGRFSGPLSSLGDPQREHCPPLR